MKADAIWVVEPGRIEVRPFLVKEPIYDEVMIKTKACGVCAWDSNLYHGISALGPFPYVIGHEASGIIVEVGDGVTNVKSGDNVFCVGECNEMMSEYVTIKAKYVHKIPDQVSNWADWVLEPTCCIVNLLEKANIKSGDHVVLVGAGYMGQLTLQGLMGGSLAGKVTVFELRDKLIDISKQHNPYCVVNPESEEGKKVIEAIIHDGGADVVIDFAASQSGYELATLMLKEAGSFVLGTWHRSKMKFDGTQWHKLGVTVYNLSPTSNSHYSEMLPATYELVNKGVYEPGGLVTHTANFRDAKEVFERSIDKRDGYIKGVILFD